MEGELTVMLFDAEPLSDTFSGGAGHSDGPDWTTADGQLAAEFYATTQDSARRLLDSWIDRPGPAPGATGIDGQIFGLNARNSTRQERSRQRHRRYDQRADTVGAAGIRTSGSGAKAARPMSYSRGSRRAAFIFYLDGRRSH